MLNKDDIISLQKAFQSLVEGDLAKEIAKFDPKSQDTNLGYLKAASIMVQQAINQLGHIVESLPE